MSRFAVIEMTTVSLVQPICLVPFFFSLLLSSLFIVVNKNIFCRSFRNRKVIEFSQEEIFHSSSIDCANRFVLLTSSHLELQFEWRR